MRICLLADARSVHIHQLTKALVTEGHTIHIVTHKPVVVRGASVEKFRVPNAHLLHPHRWSKRLGNYLRSFVRDFDVVNIHFLNDWGYRPEEGDWDLGCIVCSAWGSDVCDPPGEIAADERLQGVRRQMLRHAAVVTTCGSAFAHVVGKFADLETDRIRIAPFGVDCQLFYPKIQTSTSTTQFKIGCFKGFRQVYGIPRLIQAMPIIEKAISGIQLTLAGDGPQLQHCRQLAQSLGLMSRIQWLGYQAHHSLPEILSDWNLSVLPSIHEAFGVAALESSAMGIPVVASSAIGFQDTVRDGVTGVRVNAEIADELADCIVNLLQNSTKRQEMGCAGRSWTREHYDWRRLSGRWTQILNEALDRSVVMI